MAANRPTTRRRSVKQAFDDDDAPVSKRPRTEVNGAGRKANGAAKRAKATYDEDDDGFQFSRRTSRRTAKAQAIPAPEPVPEAPSAHSARSQDPLPAKSTARRKKTSIAAIEPESSDTQRRRRSTRLSGDKEQLEVRTKAAAPVTAKRSKKGAPLEERKRQITPAADSHHEYKSPFVGIKTPTHNELTVAKKRDPNAQRIMLPFADTPVILRNKEMRKGSKEGHRRSSTGLRGRRASSLIDSGMSNAVPHSEVQVRDYYKYIEQSLPEPRRMKHLLIWCGTQALPEKPSGEVKNANAIMAARAIQQELIDDFANKPELSDWFSREETEPPCATKKPNPQNEKNKVTLQELEEEVRRLEEEKAAWEALAAPSAPPPAPSIATPHAPALSSIDPSLLSPSQAAILSTLQKPPTPAPPDSQASSVHPPLVLPSSSSSSRFTYTSSAALQSRLDALAAALEPSIDLFADGIHKIDQFRCTAERVADRILGTAARRLDERDADAKRRVGADGVGVGDVLRGLAGVLGEQ